MALRAKSRSDAGVRRRRRLRLHFAGGCSGNTSPVCKASLDVYFESHCIAPHPITLQLRAQLAMPIDLREKFGKLSSDPRSKNAADKFKKLGEEDQADPTGRRGFRCRLTEFSFVMYV